MRDETTANYILSCNRAKNYTSQPPDRGTAPGMCALSPPASCFGRCRRISFERKAPVNVTQFEYTVHFTGGHFRNEIVGLLLGFLTL